MHHKKLNKWVNFWWHTDWEINIKNVAVRELEEEAWILINKSDLVENFSDLEIHKVPLWKNQPEHFHYDISYVVKVNRNIEFKKQESEVNDIKWFLIEELKKENLYPWVLKVYKKLNR